MRGEKVIFTVTKYIKGFWRHFNMEMLHIISFKKKCLVVFYCLLQPHTQLDKLWISALVLRFCNVSDSKDKTVPSLLCCY